MARLGFMMRLKDESCVAEYERLHADVGEAVRAAHERAGYRNYSIYRDGLDLFGYFEADDPEACGATLALEPAMPEFWARVRPLMAPVEGDSFYKTIPEVFHMD